MVRGQVFARWKRTALRKFIENQLGKEVLNENAVGEWCKRFK